MYDNILVPVVFDDGHDTAASLRAAKTLANEGASFTVLHVMEVLPTYATTQIPEELLIAARVEIQGRVAELADQLPGGKPKLVSGHPGRTIVEYAEKHGVDCIVLASHKPGLEDYFLGSTADRVVRHAACSVHVIR